MMKRRKRKAQSILEYIIILSAIVAGVIVARSHVNSAVQTTVEDASSVIERMSTQFVDKAGGGEEEE